MAILFVASESAELKPFAQALTGLRKLSWPIDYAFEGILDGRRIVLAANGPGGTLAGKAVEVALRAVAAAELSASKLEAVVSTGFCGALDPELVVKDIVVATSVVNGAGLVVNCSPVESSQPFKYGMVLSQDRVITTAQEKQQLRLSGAVAVEMEAEGVLARSHRADLPCFCIKVVSDSAEECFEFDVNEMRTTEGRFARGKIGIHAFTHPRLFPGLLRLKRRCDNAAKALGEFLVSCRVQVESGIRVNGSGSVTPDERGDL